MGIMLFLAATEEDGPILDWKILLMAAIVIAVMIMMPRIIRRNRKERQLLEKQYRDEVNNCIGARSAADKILMQVVETGREINGVLDTKIRVLNKLIKDADDAARRLEAIAGNAPLHPSERLRASREPLTKHEITLPSTTAETIIEERQSPAEPEDTGSGRWKADIRGRIRSYAQEGRTVDEIARLTRLSKAEVNLMLELLRSENGN